METIPNHVMMMTGVRPGPLRRAGQRDLRPRARRGPRPWTGAPTSGASTRDRAAQPARLHDRHGAAARSTCTASSATAPRTAGSRRRSLPVTGHAPDVFTMDAALAMLDELDPHLMFVNLGDIDRFGHADLTGDDARGSRAGSRSPTPTAQVQRFVDALKAHAAAGSDSMRDRAGRPLDGLVDARPGDQPDRRARRRPAARRQGRRSPTTAAPTSSTGPAPADQRAAAVERMRAIAHAQPGRARGPRPPHAVAAARPRGRRRRRLLQGRLAVQRPGPGHVQPDPRQPRPPGDPRDPVLHRRRPPRRAAARASRRARAHRRRRADGRRVLPARRTARRVRRPQPLL